MKKFLLVTLFAGALLHGGEVNPYWFQNGEKSNVKRDLVEKNKKNWVDPYWFQKKNKKISKINASTDLNS